MQKKSANTQTFNTKARVGFTLIEMLVVAALIIMLTSIGFVTFRTVSQRSRNSKRAADISVIQSGLETYRSTYSTYPVYSGSNQVTNFNSLMGNSTFTNFLTTSTVADPLNTAPYRYTYQSSSNGFTYSICYYAEPSGTASCFSSP